MTDNLTLNVDIIPNMAPVDAALKKPRSIISKLPGQSINSLLSRWGGTRYEKPPKTMRGEETAKEDPFEVFKREKTKVGKVHIDPLDKEDKGEEKQRTKRETEANKERKKFSLKTIGILTGIAYTLTNVPSILGGVLKMLGLGFLLILKPLADLLAMILLPIAKMVIDVGAWLNDLAGSGLGGMLMAAVIGLIIASIGLLTIAIVGGIISATITSLITTAIGATSVKLAGEKIATAITNMATTAIGATTLINLLGAVLIAGALTGIIVKALGATDTEALVTGVGAAILAGLLVVFGAPFWASVALAVSTAVGAFLLVKGAQQLGEQYAAAQNKERGNVAMDLGIDSRDVTNEQIYEYKRTHTPSGEHVRALGGPVIGGQSYLVGEQGPEMFTPMSNGNITPNNRLGGNGQSINISVNGIFEERKLEQMIKSIVNQAMQGSTKVRGTTY